MTVGNIIVASYRDYHVGAHASDSASYVVVQASTLGSPCVVLPQLTGVRYLSMTNPRWDLDIVSLVDIGMVDLPYAYNPGFRLLPSGGHDRRT
jgi:hypothetical protein